MAFLLLRSSVGAAPAQAVGSLSFPGGSSTANSGAVTIPRSGSANIGAGDFTIEMWLRPSATAADNNETIAEGNQYVGEATDGNIIMDSDDTTNGGCWILGLSTGRPYFGVNAASQVTRIANTDIRDGQWHHVVWQRAISNGLLEIWVDGTREESFDGPNGDISYPGGGNATDALHVFGKEKLNLTFGYDGDISEIRVTNTLVYSGATITVPTAPLTAIAGTVMLYHMDEGSGSTMGDGSGDNNDGTLIGNPVPTWSTDDPF